MLAEDFPSPLAGEGGEHRKCEPGEGWGSPLNQSRSVPPAFEVGGADFRTFQQILAVA